MNFKVASGLSTPQVTMKQWRWPMKGLRLAIVRSKSARYLADSSLEKDKLTQSLRASQMNLPLLYERS
jgi:hypothetical protein